MKNSVVIFFCLFVFLSCTYTLKDRFVNPIKPPSATIKVSVDIQDPKFVDPYPLVVETTFNFKIDSTTKPIIDTQVLLDGNPITATVNGMNLSFTLNPCQLSSGNHSIKISIKIDTQSGSLADKLGGEYYIVEKDFTLVIDNNLPEVTQPLSFKIENGYLSIEWENFNKRNFYYHISYSSDITGLSSDTTIIDPTVSKFIDYGYVGGQVTYTIQLVGTCSGWTNIGPQEFNLNPANFTFTTNNDFVELLSWDSLYINPANTTVELKTSKTDKTTAVLSQGNIVGDSIPIGMDETAQVIIQRKNYPNHKYVANISLSSKKNFPTFINLTSTTQSIFVVDVFNRVSRISLSNFEKEDSIRVDFPTLISQFAISNNNQIGIGLNSGLIWKFNPSDFSVVSYIQFNSTNFISTVNNISSPLSSNQLMGINYVQDYTYTDPSNTPTIKPNVAGIMDLSSNNIVWSDTSNNDTPVVSSDGNYFVVSNSLKSENIVYKNNNGIWNFLGIVPAGAKYFRNNSTTELLVMNSNSILVFDLSQPKDANNNFTVERSFSIDQNQIVGSIGYDNASQDMYVEYFNSSYYPKVSTIKVYDVQSFNYKGAGAAYLDGSTTYGIHVYSNGHHFLSTGYVQKIE